MPSKVTETRKHDCVQVTESPYALCPHTQLLTQSSKENPAVPTCALIIGYFSLGHQHGSPGLRRPGIWHWNEMHADLQQNPAQLLCMADLWV